MPECLQCGNDEEFEVDVSVTEIRVFRGPDLQAIERTDSHGRSSYRCIECGAEGDDIELH